MRRETVRPVQIAIIDDDRDEHLIIAETLIGEMPNAVFQGFTQLSDFLAAGPGRFDHVFLDRCLPPVSDYESNLRQLEEAGFQGHVILMSASVMPVSLQTYGFDVTGPLDKYSLLEPKRVAAYLTA